MIKSCLWFILNCFTLVHAKGISYAILDSNNVPLDYKIAKRIGITHGTFIEVGANDGIIQSNTKLLEEFYDWTGILVEPSSILYDRLVHNRPHSQCFQCALGSLEQNNTYLYGDFFDGAMMSSINGERRKYPATERVFVRTLQSILDEVNLYHINFFSLDVEGYELNVLKGIDFTKTSFDYIMIEIYISDYNEIVDLLKLNGYELIENFSNYNFIANPIWDGTHNDYLFKRTSL